MLALEKCGGKRFWPMAMFAQAGALAAGNCYKAIVTSREQWLLKREEAFAIRANKDWLNLCRRPGRMVAGVLYFLLAPEQPHDLADSIGGWPQAYAANRRDFNQETSPYHRAGRFFAERRTLSATAGTHLQMGAFALAAAVAARAG